MSGEGGHGDIGAIPRCGSEGASGMRFRPRERNAGGGRGGKLLARQRLRHTRQSARFPASKEFQGRRKIGACAALEAWCVLG